MTLKQRTHNEQPIKSPRYDLGNPIGLGSWGTVYNARDNTTGDRVAIKVLTPTEVAEGQMQACNLTPWEAMRKESGLRAARHVLPRMLEVDENGKPFLVMPALDGTLENYFQDESNSRNCLNNGYPDREKTLGYMIDIASGLAELHTLYGRAYGDLKFDNILVDAFGRAVLTDLGTTTVLDSHSIKKNRGFLQTRAPEIHLGARLDTYSDSYSNAALDYRMITGVYPLEEEIEIDPRFIKTIKPGDFNKLIKKRVRRNTPKPFHNFLIRNLAYNQHNRDADGTFLRRELLNIAHEMDPMTHVNRAGKQLLKYVVYPLAFFGAINLSGHLRAPQFHRTLEDAAVSERLGRQTLFEAQDAAKSHEFKDYISAKDKNGNYIISLPDQDSLKASIDSIRKKSPTTRTYSGGKP